MTLHFLNDVVNDIRNQHKLNNEVIITSLMGESTCKLIQM